MHEGRLSPAPQANAAGRDHDEIPADLLLGELAKGRDEGLRHLGGGHLVGESGDHDSPVRTERVPEDVREAEIAAPRTNVPDCA
jgi:hypothetical protein